MNQTINRRKAPRLRCRVTVQFAKDATEPGSEGQMLDVSSGGLAFRCNADENCPHEGEQLVTHFSIPNFSVHDNSMLNFSRTGRVLRVQEVNPALRNVAIRFDEPLPVGKVFFDTIGLYRSNPESQSTSTSNDTETVEEKSLELTLEKRIKELEHELAQLKQMQPLNPQCDEAE
jgi:hypothetical protein